jgi:hypothetical protein
LVNVGVGVAVPSGVLVGVGVAVLSGVLVSVGVGVAVLSGVLVGVGVAVPSGVLVGVGVGVGALTTVNGAASTVCGMKFPAIDTWLRYVPFGVPGRICALIVARKKPPVARMRVPLGQFQRTMLPVFSDGAGSALRAWKPCGSRSSSVSRLTGGPKLKTVIA